MKDQRHKDGSADQRRNIVARYPWISSIMTFLFISLISLCAKTWASNNSQEETLKWHTEWIKKSADSVNSVPHLVEKVDDFVVEQRKMNDKLDNKLDYLIREAKRTI